MKMSMEINKNFNIDKFSEFFVLNKDTPHAIKLVVDDVIIEVSRVVLSCWSEEFEKRADKDLKIFLTNLTSNKEAVHDCVSLLHGEMIDFSLTKVPIILKFAGVFKIPEMIEEVTELLHASVSLTNILQVMEIAFDLEKAGHTFEGLITVIKQFIKRDRDNCMKLFAENFDAKKQLIITILIRTWSEIMLKECLQLFKSYKTKTEDDYKYLLDKLENIPNDKEYILTMNIDGIKKVENSVLQDVMNVNLLKLWITFVRTTTEKSSSSNCIPDSLNENTIKFQSWRLFNYNQMLQLKRTYQISEYEYSVILLDWVEFKKPKQGNVKKLYRSIDQQSLAESHISNIQNMLTGELGYDCFPMHVASVKFDYNLQYWDGEKIPKQKLLESLTLGTTLEISSEECEVEGCERFSLTISIRLIREGDKLDIQVVHTDDVHAVRKDDNHAVRTDNNHAVRTNDVGDEKHNHPELKYCNWMLENVDTKMYSFPAYPLYTKSSKKVTTFLYDRADYPDITLSCFVPRQ